MDSLQGWR
jgi:hypothetical protein